MPVSRREFLIGSGVVVAGTAVSAAGMASAVRGAGEAWKLPPKRPFRVVENEWVTLKDGTRLAARIWIPDGAETSPVPVVWEYLPYRKRDSERRRDTGWAEMFVPYGFAFVRVDIRGSGDSDGVLLGEYLQQEQDDALEVIDWLARRPWSNGAVGMRGISWGGFSSLQAAALAPPALKAIIPQCASDNRYTDDAHYVGGALTLDNYDWGAEFKTVLVGPPDPAIVGPRWREMWMQRLEATPPILARVAVASAIRRFLAARLGGDGLLAHQMSGLCGGRTDRFVSRFSAAPAGESRGAPQGTHGSVGTQVSAAGGCGTGPRLGHRGGALVDPMAARRRYRNHGRADVAGVHGRANGCRSVAPRCSRPLGHGALLASPARAPAYVVSQHRWPIGETGSGGCPADSLAGDPGTHETGVVSLEFEHRPAAGSNTGRPALVDVRFGAR